MSPEYFVAFCQKYANVDLMVHWYILTFPQAKSIVRDLDPTNSLTFLRLKSHSHEVLVAPEDNFIILVLQQNVDPSKQ